MCPNFIHVKLPELNIIGIRVRTLANYTNRKDQVLSVTNYIESKKLKKVLFLGDFNNSAIKGDSTKCYEEVREKYHWTSKNEVSDLYDTYNYHILKDLLPKDFSIYTPEGYSWKKFKLDHLITDLKIVDMKPYIWTDFSDHAMLVVEIDH